MPANDNDDASSSVQVVIRVRPLLAFEQEDTKCVSLLTDDSSQCSSNNNYPNVVRIGGESGPTFCFDRTFDGSTPQQKLYEENLLPLIESCLEGYNATAFAYGQTGSGKTYTMTGPTTTTSLQEEKYDDNAGMIPRSIESLFNQLNEWRDTRTTMDTKYEYEVCLQYLEIYRNEIRDLLTEPESILKPKLEIFDIGEDEPEVLGAKQIKVDSAQEALACLTSGMSHRVTGSTAMNTFSSRSHALLSIIIKQTNTAENGHTSTLRSKFNFVDLAGSERQKRAQTEGIRLKEAIDINKGLLALGNVISALGDDKKIGKTHIPYRDSKLTRLLKGSLGGNHKTLMIACISSSRVNLEESLNCLRYANRAKNIQNNAIVNIDANTKLVTHLNGHIIALATELLRIKKLNNKIKEGEKSDIIIDSKFSEEVLNELIKGNASLIPNTYVNCEGPENSFSLIPHSSESFFKPISDQLQQEERLRQSESLLNETKKSLETTKGELQLMTEEVFNLRAETETYGVQSAQKRTRTPIRVVTPVLEKEIHKKSNFPLNPSSQLQQQEKYELEKLTPKKSLETAKRELQLITEEVFTLRAEKETYGVQSAHKGTTTPVLEKEIHKKSNLLLNPSSQLHQQEKSELEKLPPKLEEMKTLRRKRKRTSMGLLSPPQLKMRLNRTKILRSQIWLANSPLFSELLAGEGTADAKLDASKQKSKEEYEERAKIFEEKRENIDEERDNRTTIDDNHWHQQLQIDLKKLSDRIDERIRIRQEKFLDQMGSKFGAADHGALVSEVKTSTTRDRKTCSRGGLAKPTSPDQSHQEKSSVDENNWCCNDDFISRFICFCF